MNYFDKTFWRMTAYFLAIIAVGLLGVYFLDWLSRFG